MYYPHSLYGRSINFKLIKDQLWNFNTLFCGIFSQMVVIQRVCDFQIELLNMQIHLKITLPLWKPYGKPFHGGRWIFNEIAHSESDAVPLYWELKVISVENSKIKMMLPDVIYGNVRRSGTLRTRFFIITATWKLLKGTRDGAHLKQE